MWPNANLKLMLTLFGLTALLLLAPKVLSLAAIVLRGQARQFGGVSRLLFGALIEFVHSLLLAPVRMLFHTQFVLAALTGWRLDWQSPPRDDAVTGWSQAWRRHGVHTLLALLWISAILASSAAFPWWLAPVIVGLLVAIPLSTWSSRAGPGRWLRTRGVLLIPEESRQPPVLAQARKHALAFGPMPVFVDAIVGAVAHEHIARSIPLRRHAAGLKARSQARLVDHAVNAGPQGLDAAQRLRLLGDAQALRSVRAQVLLRQAHPAWWLPAAAPERRGSKRTETRPGRPATAVH
jgi:membrane glycosyltransferase